MDDDEELPPPPVKQGSKEVKIEEPAEEQKKIQLSEQDVQEFREIFNLIDTDGSGCISPEELGALIEQVGLKITQEELDEMVREIDVDGSGEIDFHEFLETMSRDINPNYSPNEVCRAFKMFARSAPSGLIKMKDLDEALKVYLHGKVDHMDIHSVLKAFDDSLVKLPDSEELYFNYMDYVNLMMPDRPGSEDWVQKRKTMDGENMAGLGSALDKVRSEKKDEERKVKREQRKKEREAKAKEITHARKK
jgi:Ca2+-binding EF-hand superfamily protein